MGRFCKGYSRLGCVYAVIWESAREDSVTGSRLLARPATPPHSPPLAPAFSSSLVLHRKSKRVSKDTLFDFGGPERTRTSHLRFAKALLYQMSYGPVVTSKNQRNEYRTINSAVQAEADDQ